MTLRVLPNKLSVAKFDAIPDLPEGFCSLSVLEGEISLVCETESLPQGAIAREDGWRALMVVGPLDFSLVGILAEISSILAEERIPIFVLSTYDTDYVLVKETHLPGAVRALIVRGMTVIEG